MPRPKAEDPKARQHVPLSEEYMPSYALKQKPGNKRRKSQVEDDNVIDAKSSHKILKIGQELADEDESEALASLKARHDPAFHISSRKLPGHDAGQDGEDEEEEVIYEEAWEDDDDAPVDGQDIDPKDLEIFNKFNPQMDPSTLLAPKPSVEDPSAKGPGIDLSALILEKIAAFEASQDPAKRVDEHGREVPADAVQLPKKAVEVYEQVALIMSRYKSGKLPKPFKILPGVPQWEIYLEITQPQNWTPNACYEATKLFTSSRPAVAQAFFYDILLPRVQEDIQETKQLNVHLYKSLKKALYKPAAFFKGILFPLVETGNCTLREAHIISSVLARVSIPVLHSAAAIHRLCEVAADQMSSNVESGGATNIFIRTLLEKKYALPYRVIDALVFHFMRFRVVDAEAKNVNLPVLWHQCLLAFAQRYKNDITEDQREALLDLLLNKAHSKIGPEVRRELLEGRGRGIPVADDVDMGGDDTMMVA